MQGPTAYFADSAESLGLYKSLHKDASMETGRVCIRWSWMAEACMLLVLGCKPLDFGFGLAPNMPRPYCANALSSLHCIVQYCGNYHEALWATSVRQSIGGLDSRLEKSAQENSTDSQFRSLFKAHHPFAPLVASRLLSGVCASIWLLEDCSLVWQQMAGLFCLVDRSRPLDITFSWGSWFWDTVGGQQIR